jgi:phosphoenolpyruvate carboxykinase (ATP)
MENTTQLINRPSVEDKGLSGTGRVFRNLSRAELYEHAIRNREAILSIDGPLVALTGDHTGRAPNDKFVVRAGASAENVWWGSVNRPFEEERFDALATRLRAYLDSRDRYVFDGYAGADPHYRMPVRIVTEFAWHSLFASNMFVNETDAARRAALEPEFTVLAAPSFQANPEIDGTNSGTFILVDMEQSLAIIGGTHYAGEIKKSIFSVMNYYLPLKGVLSMHCSANYGTEAGDVALFFGLSGTGKTTLSADRGRTLIGDDEHGWSDNGIFNIEGGCYAKVIRLSPEGEPHIYATTRRFGTILENVVVDPLTRTLDLDDDRYTENTRASYPIEHLPDADVGGCTGHPRNIVFLTADAFGILPPISRLSNDQALYHFLSGYTAKVAGTEQGVTEPKATFSACFGAPFMPLHPGSYAKLLSQKMRRHGTKAWLVNTGWTGGPHGTGKRIDLAYTRRMINAALAGALDDAPTQMDPTFGLAVPNAIEGVPSTVLHPRDTWEDPDAYDARAAELAQMFRDNFEQYRAGVPDNIANAGPLPAVS